MSILKHNFILICLLIASNVVFKRIWNPNITWAERLFLISLLAGLALFVSSAIVYLDELDEQVWKNRSGFE